MEKQPIDDLFAQKLREVEVQPGDDVFGRLQNRQKAIPLPTHRPNRRVAGWWYSMAAACVLTPLGWLLWPVEMEQMQTNGEKVTKQVQEKPVSGQVANERAAIGLSTGKAMAAHAPMTQIRSRAEPTAEVVGATLVPTHAPVARNVAELPEITPQETTPPIAEPMPQADVANTKSMRQPVAAERTIVMVIDVPEEKVAGTLQPAASPVAVTLSQPNLSQLFTKVKQLKSGDVLARATPTRPVTEPRTGFGRLFNGVKESLRNDNTLEP
jgi:hypothetical protein